MLAVHGLKVSVVIPTVRRSEVLRAVASALGQTYPPLEVLVVVDSRDQSVNPGLLKISDQIQILTTGGIGPSGARMRGVDEARGDVIAFLDDDDEWIPNKLERQMAMWPAEAGRGDHTLISSGVAITDSTGTVLRTLPDRRLQPGERIPNYLFRRTSLGYGEGFIHPSAIICDRDLVVDEPWDPAVTRHEDWDWLLRVGLRSDVSILMCSDALVRVALAGRSLSNDWRSSLTWVEERAGLLTPRERGDFLLCHTATSAFRSHRRLGGLIAARRALTSGRPGVTAWVVWLLHMLSPSLVDRMSRLRSQLTRGRPGPGLQGGNFH